MWNKILTNKEIEVRDIEIKKIFDHFAPLLPNIEKELLYKRIAGGYIAGEGLGPLTTIEEWEGILIKGVRLSVFDNWDDYLKYGGDNNKKAIDMGWIENR